MARSHNKNKSITHRKQNLMYNILGRRRIPWLEPLDPVHRVKYGCPKHKGCISGAGSCRKDYSFEEYMETPVLESFISGFYSASGRIRTTSPKT